ncbi:MAG: hypothetical protein ACHRXM_17720 [Isosphaerales bacterium]
MPQTIQCKHCGIVLNLPPGAKGGKRLKCPRCSTRFVISDAEAASASTMPGMDNATSMSAFDLTSRPGSGEALPTLLPEGDLRETFDLPLVSGREAEQGQAVPSPGVADAAALFSDPGPSHRKITAAEARARARRCVHCGGVVPQGMSICVTCGTDQETGLRVGLEDDLAPPPRPPSQGPPIHVATVGGLCIAASLLLLALAIRGASRGESSLEHSGWLCLALVAVFGIYASVQFIRGKTARLLIVALSVGVMVDVMTLIALPIVQANFEAPDKFTSIVKPEDPDDSNIRIKPLEDRIDTSRISLGIALILIYALLSLYLISPPVKKYIHSQLDRGA